MLLIVPCSSSVIPGILPPLAAALLLFLAFFPCSQPLFRCFGQQFYVFRSEILEIGDFLPLCPDSAVIDLREDQTFPLLPDHRQRFPVRAVDCGQAAAQPVAVVCAGGKAKIEERSRCQIDLPPPLRGPASGRRTKQKLRPLQCGNPRGFREFQIIADQDRDLPELRVEDRVVCPL